MVCKKYFNLTMFTGTILVSSLPVYAGTIDVNEEVDAHNKIRTRAGNLVAPQTLSIREQADADAAKLQEEVEANRRLSGNLEKEKNKKLEEVRSSTKPINEKLRLLESRLKSLQEEKNATLAASLKPHQETIEPRRPEFERAAKELKEALSNFIDYTKTDSTIKGIYNYNRQVKAYDQQIKEVWDKTMETTQYMMDGVREGFDNFYNPKINRLKKEIDLVSRELKEMGWKIMDTLPSLEAEYDGKIKEVHKTISLLNAKVREIQRPYNQQIDAILQDVELALIEGREIEQPNGD